MEKQLSIWRWAVGGVLLSSAIGLGFWGITTTDVHADRYEGEHEWGSKNRASNPLYSEECGSCHFAYPAGMLPANSWKAIMAELDNHFDENAELDADTQRQLETYLIASAADNGNYQNRRYLGTLSNNKPILRISEQPYFIREHDEIPDRWIKGNDKVGSFSQCDSCHQSAAQGDFDEDGVVIPGYGRWDD